MSVARLIYEKNNSMNKSRCLMPWMGLRLPFTFHQQTSPRSCESDGFHTSGILTFDCWGLLDQVLAAASMWHMGAGWSSGIFGVVPTRLTQSLIA